ncbi:MAG TPA: NRDE family protein [Anaeromyxobacteraceae bacterium]|nr:NRDE family protein [Anaeromyxobacteraceae bacterium]
MCTLAIALGSAPRWPVIVAANRDERLSRESEPWALRSGPGAIPYVAPRDAVAGGTWIGVSASGLFAAVTNVFTGAPPDPTRRSRGELVGLALAHAGVADARRALADVAASDFNPFHLAVADADGAFLWRHDGTDPATFAALGPGLHVVTERGSGPLDARARAVRAAWPAEPTPERLGALLARHEPGEPICIHFGDAYGTRSATVLRLSSDVSTSDLWTSDVAPCVALPEDRSELLRAVAVPG